jgi:hypothetical protein
MNEGVSRFARWNGVSVGRAGFRVLKKSEPAKLEDDYRQVILSSAELTETFSAAPRFVRVGRTWNFKNCVGEWRFFGPSCIRAVLPRCGTKKTHALRKGLI